MAIFSAIAKKVKEIINKMIGKQTIEQALHISTIMSSVMENEIQLWQSMYMNRAPWLHEPSELDASRVTSLGLPALIASEKARMALLEWQSEITTPTISVDNDDNTIDLKKEKPTSDKNRAQYLDTQYKKLKRHIRRQLEYGIALGGLVIKPYIVRNDDSTVKTMTVEDGNKVITTTKPKFDIEFDFIRADSFYPIAFDGNGKITEAAFIQTKTDKSICI